MDLDQNRAGGNAPNRPALSSLIAAMANLSRVRRVEVACIGRKARAAKVPRIRRLTWRAVVEARRLAQVDDGHHPIPEADAGTAFRARRRQAAQTFPI
jgi:hypothetical protein